MRTVEPSQKRLQTFLEGAEPEGPVTMINLLRYNDRAQYPDGFEAEPCTGREAYQRYGAVAAKLIAEAGGRALWVGSVSASVIAPDEETWDDAILVEYPSRAAFLEMVSSPAYQAVAPHRTAALLDSRLIATKTVMGALDG
jgi:uncharacterized protein (DUF1330 family)